MKEVELKGHKVTLYTSIEELPMARFHKYNKCLLIDAGIGSDMSSVDGHIERVVRYVRADKREDAGKELENLRQNIYMILQGMSPSHLSFACLVASIDGKDCTDMSDEGLQRIVDLLGDVPVSDVTAESDAVKKKIDDELTVYFPSIFDDSRSKEYYDKMKERAIAMLDEIIKGRTEEREARIERLTDELVTFMKPRTFTGMGSVEIEYDRQFEDMCLLISQNLHTDPKRMTVLEYYNAYQYIERQAKEQKRQNKRR
jgi:hypothetical protein